jgi:PDZ domain
MNSKFILLAIVFVMSSLVMSNFGMSLSAHAADPPAGVGLLIISDKPAHYVVQYVLPDMTAAKAKIAVGDVILAVDDYSSEKVTSLDELVARIRGASGSTVKLTISSAGKSRDVSLIRGAIPNIQSQPPADMDFGRTKSVYFYPREDLFPDESSPTSALFHTQAVRDFLRGEVGTR